MNSANGHASIRVKVYGPLRAFVSSTDQQIDVAKGLSVRQLVSDLGVPDDQMVYTMCLINERRVPLDSPIADGDVLDVFQPVAGG
jgi:molybdopterin converting factor small subunit